MMGLQTVIYRCLFVGFVIVNEVCAICDNDANHTHPGTMAYLQQANRELEERVMCLEQTVDQLIDYISANARLIDCRDVYNHGERTAGVYAIWPRWSELPVHVYCRQGWTLIQRRLDATTPFDRAWHEYTHGFGTLTHNFWLGLEKIHQLTNQRASKIRIEITDWDDSTKYAEYSVFSIGDGTSKYALTWSGYNGTLGISSYNNQMAFSTKDQDNDAFGGNCASQYHGDGGWWYNACTYVNLNGAYKQYADRTDTVAGIYWHAWKPHYSFKQTVMMIDRSP